MKHMANILPPVTQGIRSCKLCACRALGCLQSTGEILMLQQSAWIFPSPSRGTIVPQEWSLSQVRMRSQILWIPVMLIPYRLVEIQALSVFLWKCWNSDEEGHTFSLQKELLGYSHSALSALIQASPFQSLVCWEFILSSVCNLVAVYVE